MPFDPRLIHPEEPPEDFDAVLAELGNQLRDDARMLAAKYPAKRTSEKRPQGSPRRWWIAGAAVAAVALTAVVVSLPRSQPEAHLVMPSAPEVTPVSTNIAVSAPLDDFTGPELEGVLDLLESQDDGRASLSL